MGYLDRKKQEFDQSCEECQKFGKTLHENRHHDCYSSEAAKVHAAARYQADKEWKAHLGLGTCITESDVKWPQSLYPVPVLPTGATADGPPEIYRKSPPPLWIGTKGDNPHNKDGHPLKIGNFFIVIPDQKCDTSVSTVRPFEVFNLKSFQVKVLTCDPLYIVCFQLTKLCLRTFLHLCCVCAYATLMQTSYMFNPTTRNHQHTIIVPLQVFLAL
jgi:hypothetical protein